MLELLPLLDLLLILRLPLPLLLRPLESDFFIIGFPFLSSSGFLGFWEVSSTEDEELLSLTFLVPPDELTLFDVSLFSTNDVWRLKSPLGVVDWVILRLALGGWMLLEVGVLLADWLGV